MAEPLLVPRGGVRPSSKRTLIRSLRTRALNRGVVRTGEEELRQVPVLLALGLALPGCSQGWLRDSRSQIPGGSVHLCVSGLRSLGEGAVSRGVRVLVYLVQELNFTTT